MKEEFLNLLRSVKREGIDDLIRFIESTDFFTAPASTRFHGDHAGGLVEHSMKVYEILQEKVKNAPIALNTPPETLIIVPLLHDLCKINCYKKGTRNVKKDGQWIQVPNYEYDDQLPYGHGEKSVYMISGYMRLTREEAFAIRYHMGFSGNEDARNVGKAFEMFPIAFALSVADMEATYFIEGKK